MKLQIWLLLTCNSTLELVLHANLLCKPQWVNKCLEVCQCKEVKGVLRKVKWAVVVCNSQWVNKCQETCQCKAVCQCKEAKVALLRKVKWEVVCLNPLCKADKDALLKWVVVLCLHVVNLQWVAPRKVKWEVVCLNHLCKADKVALHKVKWEVVCLNHLCRAGKVALLRNNLCKVAHLVLPQWVSNNLWVNYNQCRVVCHQCSSNLCNNKGLWEEWECQCSSNLWEGWVCRCSNSQWG